MEHHQVGRRRYDTRIDDVTWPAQIVIVAACLWARMLRRVRKVVAQ